MMIDYKRAEVLVIVCQKSKVENLTGFSSKWRLNAGRPAKRMREPPAGARVARHVAAGPAHFTDWSSGGGESRPFVFSFPLLSFELFLFTVAVRWRCCRRGQMQYKSVVCLLIYDFVYLFEFRVSARFFFWNKIWSLFHDYFYIMTRIMSRFTTYCLIWIFLYGNFGLLCFFKYMIHFMIISTVKSIIYNVRTFLKHNFII